MFQKEYNGLIIVEWYSIACRTTKTKVITPTNHQGHRQYRVAEPIKLRVNTFS